MVKDVNEIVVCKENCKVWRVEGDGNKVKRLVDEMTMDECEITENEVVVVEFKGKLEWVMKDKEGEKMEYKCKLC